MNQRLIDARTEAKLSKQQLAELSGVSIGSINNIEGGRTANPRKDTMQLICKALGKTLDGLFWEDKL